MEHIINHATRFLTYSEHQGPFVILLPHKQRKPYLKALFEVNDDELNEILGKMELILQAEGWPCVRAEIIQYMGIEYALIDPERFYVK